ncbi:L-type lectin-domain-containing protein [Cinnamomum micranthum f. kanehirae]|uniref:L-type lectin-domain-containing protein n=1 Tax=Cinnamomum micranthum f. kanehirae TaxID=337451 RepID=A0A3S3Q697_9MAGN|nr:L-type lectin-domain-containing protein [Cinnamomum micranthum f. kanehirae]
MDHEVCGQTTVIAGTLGYLAPECVTSGRASKESDVYSFGVVLLEIACGRKPVEVMEDESMVKLVEWVWELHRNGRILEAADKKLRLEYDVREMECLMMVGLWCAQPDPNLRPSIRQAMRVLNLEEEMPDLPNMTVLMAMNQVPLQAAHSNPPSVTNSCLYMAR